MAIKIKNFNYMLMSSEITQGLKYQSSNPHGYSPKEFVDARLAELRMLANNPDLQLLAVFLEQEIAHDIRFYLGRRDNLAETLYALRACDAFNAPIASSLSAAKIESFRHVKVGSPAFEKWDENQQWYAMQMLTSGRTKLKITPKTVTLSTGIEQIDHSINQYSFSIAQYFYAIQVASECFPDEIVKIAQHAVGVEQVKNSRKSKQIRQTIATNVESGDFPEPIDTDAALDRNLSLLSEWIKPRDTQVAEAYVKGKRDIAWLEQYAPATVILAKVTEDLAIKGFHQKWSGGLPILIMDLAEHLIESHPKQARDALYDLATAMAADKVLGFEGAQEALERIGTMVHKLTGETCSSIRGELAMKLIGGKLGLESAQVIGKYIADNDLTKTAESIMEKLYSNTIERAKVMESYGIKSNSSAMMRAKGRALMDDLGM